MKLSDVFSSAAVAAYYTEAAGSNDPYVGAGLFPAKKKAGLDLKWIKGHKGLPVSLAPAAFDTKSTIRDRIGIAVTETKMPFFRESMLVTEEDEQEIMRVEDSNDPYAQEVLTRIFDDAQTLVEGADVVPERMRMQLLAPLGGSMGIEISADGVNYAYNYDPSGEWKKKHYLKIVGETDLWSAADTCDPLKDLQDAMGAQEAESGTRPTVALMSQKTFNYLKNSKKVQSAMLAQNATANIFVSNKTVKALLKEELGLDVIVYTRMYKNESGTEEKFYPDNIVMLLPAGEIGSTFYGTTPEERTLMASGQADVSIVNTGVAVTVTTTSDPVNTKTTVSEILLPSFERMDDCYALEVA